MRLSRGRSFADVYVATLIDELVVSSRASVCMIRCTRPYRDKTSKDNQARLVDLQFTCNMQVNSANVTRVAQKTIPSHRSGCPVNISLEVFGDRWSLLIVRDLMVRGFRTFGDFQRAGEGVATNILADRLRRLCRAEIVRAERDPADGRQKHYRLTEKGIDLAPVLLELLIWGAKHEKTDAPAQVISEMARNRDAVLEETRRRWKERDPRALLPWLGGPQKDDRL